MLHCRYVFGGDKLQKRVPFQFGRLIPKKFGRCLVRNKHLESFLINNDGSHGICFDQLGNWIVGIVLPDLGHSIFLGQRIPFETRQQLEVVAATLG